MHIQMEDSLSSYKIQIAIPRLFLKLEQHSINIQSLANTTADHESQ